MLSRLPRFARTAETAPTADSPRCNYYFSGGDGDERFRGVCSVIDVLLQRGQVRLRHSGRRSGRKVSAERHRAEAAAAAAEVVPRGGDKSLREAHFHDLRRRLQEKVGHAERANNALHTIHPPRGVDFKDNFRSIIDGAIPKLQVSLSTVVSNFKTRT